MPRYALALSLVLVMFGVVNHAAALPSCDLLRKCSGELAEAYRASGFPSRVVRQYRRNSVTRFERAEASHPGLCRKTLSVIINNAIEMHKRGRLKYLPPSCTRAALERLPKTR